MKPIIKEDLTRILKLAGLNEAVIRTTDTEMDDYYDTAPEETYVVAWTAQYWEWYGNSDPQEGDGRYKAKGDGGEVIAINVPDKNTATALLDDLNKRLESEDFGKAGVDHSYLSGVDAYVDTMTNYKKRFTYGGEFDQEYFGYETKHAKDYGKEVETVESIRETMSTSLNDMLKK
jgi:hypothetical protein